MIGAWMVVNISSEAVRLGCMYNLFNAWQCGMFPMRYPCAID